MGIEVTQVKVELAGDKKAGKKLDKLDKKMDEVKRSAVAASSAVSATDAKAKGGLGSRWLALKAGAKKRGILKEESLEWGPLALTRGGFAVPEEFRKGQTAGRAGPLLRGAFVATVAGQAIGASLNAAADAVDFLKKRPSWEEIKDASTDVALDASSALYETVGAKSILKGGHRLAGGNPEVFEAAYADAFSTGLTAVQKQAADGTELAAIRALAAASIKAEEAKKDALRKQLETQDAEYAKVAKGLKTKIHGIKGTSLNRQANQDFQTIMRDHDQERLKEMNDKRTQPAREMLQEMEGW